MASCSIKIASRSFTGAWPIPRADEVVLTASAARQGHVHIGQVVPVGLFTTANARVPSLRIDVKVVGIVVFNNGVVQDDIDAAYGFVVVTPALLREAIAKLPVTAVPFTYGLRLARGSRDVATVEREVVAAIPGGEVHQFHATAPVVTQVEEAMRPESIALGAFGFIALLVTLVLAAQAMARQIRLGNEDRAILRALGASRGVASADGVIGVMLAVLVGAVLAVVVAVALSPLAPLGPVRAVYPGSGVAFDWTVLGGGFAVLVVILGATAATITISQAPRRNADSRAAWTRRSRVASAATNTGLPTPAATGVRYALERGAGRATVPVRSALIGTVLAVAMVCATITFASSLHTLVSRPKLYGWNWTYMINPSMEVPPITRTLLDRDHDVTWTPVDYDLGVLDGQTVPTLLANPNAAIAPPTLTGHGLEADNQIVIGQETLARLHKHVGQTVVFTYGTPASKALYIPPRTLRIVGTATFPAIGFLSFVADHTSMGTGALLPMDIRPPAFRKAELSPDSLLNGPDIVFVRARSGVSATVVRGGLAARRARDRQGPERRPGRDRRQHHAHRRAAPGSDRQLPQHRRRARAPGGRTRARRRVRARTHAHRFRPPTAARARAAEDARLHPPPARGDGGGAGDGHRPDRHRGRDPLGRRHRALALDTVRTCDLGRSAAHGPRARDRRCRHRHAGAREPRCRDPRPPRGAHTRRPVAPSRVARGRCGEGSARRRLTWSMTFGPGG